MFLSRFILKIPIKVKKKKNYDLIEVKGKQNFCAFNYKIPADISSSAFFIFFRSQLLS